MPDIHIKREHSWGLPEARKLAFQWAEAAEEKFEMECSQEVRPKKAAAKKRG